MPYRDATHTPPKAPNRRRALWIAAIASLAALAIVRYRLAAKPERAPVVHAPSVK